MPNVISTYLSLNSVFLTTLGLRQINLDLDWLKMFAFILFHSKEKKRK